MITSDSFIPTSKNEVDLLGWDYIDIIIFSGDAYIDHPSFGTAVIARVLEREGYRVAIVPQPNWRDDLRDFKKLGVPRLFFGVNSGAMDSMVNHYTANKRLRSNDAYTPDGRASQRPDYAVKVYSNILKELYPFTPVVIGGIEASLRRLTHYDYWKDTLLPSILVDSKADILVYGMGEKPIIEIAGLLSQGASIEEIKTISQVAYIADYEDNGVKDRILLNSYERCLESKVAFVENFNIIERESNSYIARHLIEPFKDKYIHINSPYEIQSTSELDSYYDLPFTKKPHPRYKGKNIPAYEMIRFSINTHRGCFGSCSFCTISAHQGKLVQSRSKESILKEIRGLSEFEDFNGYISDIGGPTANMYSMKGRNMNICKVCKKDSCIFPQSCPNLIRSHDEMLDLFEMIKNIPKVKKAFIGSGIRYDLFLNERGYLDESGRKYFWEVVVNHTSGRLKVAPEHTEEHVLKTMGKPSFKSFTFLKREFEDINRREELNYQIIPYFISSHPGCKLSDMKALSINPELKNIHLEQVQDFTPTPMTRSSVAFYSGIDPKTMKSIFVETNLINKRKQKQFFFNKR